LRVSKKKKRGDVGERNTEELKQGKEDYSDTGVGERKMARYTSSSFSLVERSTIPMTTVFSTIALVPKRDHFIISNLIFVLMPFGWLIWIYLFFF